MTAKANNVYPAPRSIKRNVTRWLTLGLVVFIYTWLGAQARTPPTLLPFQGMVLLTLCVWWIWKVARRQCLPRSPLTAPLVALLGAAMLSTAFSLDQRMSFEGLLAVTALVLFFFLICDLLVLGWQPQIFINALLLLVTLILAQSLQAIVAWYWNWYAIRVPEYPTFLVPYRIIEVAGHPNALAALVNLALPFGIMRLADAKRKWVCLGWGTWLLAADVTLFFSRSRGGWIATGVVLVFTVGWLIATRLTDPASVSARGIWWLASVTRRTWRILVTTAAYGGVFLALMIITKQSSPSAFSTNGSATGDDRFAFWAIAWRDFLAHPLTGSGLVTFGRVYTNSAGAIRAWLPVHAHNLYIDTLAQQGLIGVLALGWLLLVGARTFVRSRQKHNPLLVCICAALAGCLIHSLVDVVTALQTNALIVVLLSALGLQTVGTLQPGRTGFSRWTLGTLAVPIVLLIVLFRQNASYEALIDAIVNAREGKWSVAAQAMDSATSLDPNLDFYYGQRGYAYGVLAAPALGPGDAQALRSALNSYGVALRAEPDYVPNLLNNAALLQQAGAQQLANQNLLEALPHAQDWALPALLLANSYSNEDKATEAEKLYTAAFQHEPQARQMAACRQHMACRVAAQRVPSPVSDTSSILMQARTSIAQGQPQQAIEVLRHIPITSADPQPWIDRADAHLAAGQLPQARYALRVAETLGASGPATRARAVSSFARFYLAQGQPTSAIAVLERDVQPQIDGQAYSFFVFRRSGLPGLLVPRLDLLQRTADDLAVYRQLAHLYTQQGRTADAQWATTQGDALEALLGSDK